MIGDLPFSVLSMLASSLIRTLHGFVPRKLPNSYAGQLRTLSGTFLISQMK
jgi:hypothetical protein